MANKQNKNKNKQQKISISVPNNISSEELQSIITSAILDVQNKQYELESKQNDEDLENTKKILGVKDYNNIILKVLNTFATTVKLLFIDPKSLGCDRQFFVFFKVFTVKTFHWIGVYMYIFSLIIPLGMLIQESRILIWPFLLLAMFSFLMLYFGKVFFILSHSIAKIEKRNEFWNAFTISFSFFSVLIAIISLVISCT